MVKEKSTAWNAAKVKAFRAAFMNFIKYVSIDSKDKGGGTVLGEKLYGAQLRFLDCIFEGLAEDIHDFKILKSRQLGITTLSRALSLFWLGMHAGLKGAMVFDTNTHRDEARNEFVTMLKNLPEHLGFPKLVKDGRDLLSLSNGSTFVFLSAGVRTSKSSGTLGRSSGLNFVAASEMCSWQNEEGVVSFRNSLSETFHNRLYIWESTARGFNQWYRMWLEAKADTLNQKTCFIGWWAKESQAIARGTPMFEKYGKELPTEEEALKISEVQRLYGHKITQEQLAWIRRKTNPTQNAEGSEETGSDILEELMGQEQPWVENDSFLQTGSTFFSNDRLTEITKKDASSKFDAYYFAQGSDFTNSEWYPAVHKRNHQLKVWEEPDPDGIYVVAGDPAFGHDESNNNSAAQVLRCYADCVIQVAEYAYSGIETEPFAWVLASLAGWYKNTYLIVEINGPGEAVWIALRELKKLVLSGHLRLKASEKGLRDIFNNVRDYMYARSDSTSGPGGTMQWKCLGVDTTLPTPTGWVKLKDVKTGDKLFDERGHPCKVVGVSGVKKGRECYRVTFDDKTFLVADSGHLWEVNSEILVETKDLIPKKHTIAVTQALYLPETKLPIDPYVLGVWLGNGYSSSGVHSSWSEDAEERTKLLAACEARLGESIPEMKKTVHHQRIIGLTKTLNLKGLLNNKHIPEIYLRASFDQRLALLQGLMDTDGSISTGRQCTFTTTSDALAKGFAELVRSVGIKAKFCMRHRVLEYKGKQVACQPAYQFFFTAYKSPQIFRLTRKLKKTLVAPLYTTGKARRHKIVSVEKIKSTPVRCIQVDSPSQLYLAGESMVPTHNTSGSNKVGLMERLRDFVTNGGLIIRSYDTIEEMKTVIRNGDVIAAEGRNRDDRTFCFAMGIRAWTDSVRRMMSIQGRTKDVEAAKKRLTVKDQILMFNKHKLDSFFKNKMGESRKEAAYLRRLNWRGR